MITYRARHWSTYFVYERPDMVIAFRRVIVAGSQSHAVLTVDISELKPRLRTAITVGVSRSTKDCNAPNADAVADFSDHGPVQRATPRSKGHRRDYFKPDRYKSTLPHQGHSSSQQIQAWHRTLRTTSRNVLGVSWMGSAWPHRSSQIIRINLFWLNSSWCRHSYGVHIYVNIRSES